MIPYIRNPNWSVRSTLAVLLLLPYAAFAGVINVDAQELSELLEDNTTLVDVRTKGEWKETGIVENSLQMTFFDERGQYDAGKWLSDLMAASSPDAPVILICHTGSRTKLIAEWLDKGGYFAQIYNVRNGIDEWMRRGYSTVDP